MTQEKKDNKGERREPFKDKSMVAIGSAFRELGYKHGRLVHGASGEKINPEDYKAEIDALHEDYMDMVFKAIDLAVKRKWMAASTVTVLLIQRYLTASEDSNGKNGTPLLPAG